MCTNRSPSLECTLLYFRVAILSQQLSPSGSGVRCLQPPCSGSGKQAPCYIGPWWSSGRHTSQESGLSVCPSEKQKSTFLVRVQFRSKHLSRIRAWLGRSPHNSISSLLTPFPQTARLLSSLPQATRHNPNSRPAWLLSYTPALIVDQLHYQLHSCLLLPLSDLMARNPLAPSSGLPASLSACPHFKY